MRYISTCKGGHKYIERKYKMDIFHLQLLQHQETFIPTEEMFHTQRTETHICKQMILFAVWQQRS